MLVETIDQINVKPFLIEWPLSYCWKPLLYVSFIHIFLPGKAAFRRSENVFFFNEFFIQAVETVLFCLQLFFLLTEAIISFKSVFTSQNEGFVEKGVSTTRKKS